MLKILQTFYLNLQIIAQDMFVHLFDILTFLGKILKFHSEFVADLFFTVALNLSKKGRNDQYNSWLSFYIPILDCHVILKHKLYRM
jgi:hypothetical protein